MAVHDGAGVGVQSIAKWLDAVVARYDALEKTKQSTITVFHAQSTPDISVSDYLARISKYGNFSKSVLIAALIYIDRVLENNPEIVMTSRTIHRLLITAVLVSAKFNDDIHLGNGAYAQIGGIRNAELNRLEVNFLKLLRFSLCVSEELYFTSISAFEANAEGTSPSNVMSIFAMPEMCGLGSPIGKKSRAANIRAGDEETIMFSLCDEGSEENGSHMTRKQLVTVA